MNIIVLFACCMPKEKKKELRRRSKLIETQDVANKYRNFNFYIRTRACRMRARWITREKCHKTVIFLTICIEHTNRRKFRRVHILKLLIHNSILARMNFYPHIFCWWCTFIALTFFRVVNQYKFFWQLFTPIIKLSSAIIKISFLSFFSTAYTPPLNFFSLLISFISFYRTFFFLSKNWFLKLHTHYAFSLLSSFLWIIKLNRRHRCWRYIRLIHRTAHE